MNLTKEDYMKLPKARLAELLVELQNQVRIETVEVPAPAPSISPLSPWTSPSTSPYFPLTSPFGPSVIGHSDDMNNNSVSMN